MVGRRFTDHIPTVQLVSYYRDWSCDKSQVWAIMESMWRPMKQTYMFICYWKFQCSHTLHGRWQLSGVSMATLDIENPEDIAANGIGDCHITTPLACHGPAAINVKPMMASGISSVKPMIQTIHTGMVRRTGYQSTQKNTTNARRYHHSHCLVRQSGMVPRIIHLSGTARNSFITGL